MSDMKYTPSGYGLIGDGPPTRSSKTRPINNRPPNEMPQRKPQTGSQSRPQNRTQDRPGNQQNRTTSNQRKGTNNVEVRQQNLKKHKKNKFSLKKVVAIGTVVAGLTTGIFFATHKKDKVQVPEQFISTGVTVESDRKLDEVKGDFTFVKLNNWKNGISDESLLNISFCEENQVPYGIIIESDAVTEKEAKADAACVDAILDGKELSCPVYYDITGLCDSLDNDQVVSIAETFTDGLSSSHKSGVCVEDSYLIENDNFDCEKLVICNDFEINYDGEYNMCYFSETEQFYSTEKYEKTITYTDERGEDDIKGIDVSQYQGDIDWVQLKEQEVNFAIMRFSSFYEYHEGESLSIDDKFYENVAACQALDIPYGVYCFSTATTIAEAKLEAQKTIEALKRNALAPELPIYYDAETEFHKNNPDKTAELAKAFCAEVESNGYRAGLYASYSLIKDMVYYDDSIKDMDKWVAWYRYNSERTYDEVTEDHIPDVSAIGKYNAVQVTENALLEGITANTVDVNFANDSIGKIR